MEKIYDAGLCSHKPAWVYPKKQIPAHCKKRDVEKTTLKTVICEECGMIGYSVRGLTLIHWHWWGRVNGNAYETFIYKKAAEVWERFKVPMPVYLSSRFNSLQSN